MTTQVIFKIDKKLKDQAMQKAKREGLPFGAVLKLATKAYVDGGLNVGIVQEEKFNAKTRKEIDQALKDIKTGKNMSPAFTNVKNMDKYLSKLK